MLVYETNLSLGHQQLAYLVKVADSKYMVVGGLNLSAENFSYPVGQIVEIEPIYSQELKISMFKIEDSSLFTPLMDVMIKNMMKQALTSAFFAGAKASSNHSMWMVSQYDADAMNEAQTAYVTDAMKKLLGS